MSLTDLSLTDRLREHINCGEWCDDRHGLLIEEAAQTITVLVEERDEARALNDTLNEVGVREGRGSRK